MKTWSRFCMVSLASLCFVLVGPGCSAKTCCVSDCSTANCSVEKCSASCKGACCKSSAQCPEGCACAKCAKA